MTHCIHQVTTASNSKHTCTALKVLYTAAAAMCRVYSDCKQCDSCYHTLRWGAPAVRPLAVVPLSLSVVDTLRHWRISSSICAYMYMLPYNNMHAVHHAVGKQTVHFRVHAHTTTGTQYNSCLLHASTAAKVSLALASRSQWCCSLLSITQTATLVTFTQ